MRVLVTRPEPDGERTARRLSGLGHKTVRMPLFETVITASVDDLPTAAEISGLIATSARAFAMFQTGDVIRSGLANVPIHAVGAATAQAAIEAGFLDVRDGGGTAQALSQTLGYAWQHARKEAEPADPENRTTSIVYIAGVPRTPFIETALIAENIDHSVVECYKMMKISYSTDILKSDILSPVPDVVLLYSANAARRFSALAAPQELREMLSLTRFLCLSPAIAAELPQNWQARAIVAERPDEASLLESLTALG